MSTFFYQHRQKSCQHHLHCYGQGQHHHHHGHGHGQHHWHDHHWSPESRDIILDLIDIIFSDPLILRLPLLLDQKVVNVVKA